jgi:hypothetical protein
MARFGHRHLPITKRVALRVPTGFWLSQALVKAYSHAGTVTVPNGLCQGQHASTGRRMGTKKERAAQGLGFVKFGSVINGEPTTSGGNIGKPPSSEKTRV